MLSLNTNQSINQSINQSTKNASLLGSVPWPLTLSSFLFMSYNLYSVLRNLSNNGLNAQHNQFHHHMMNIFRDLTFSVFIIVSY